MSTTNTSAYLPSVYQNAYQYTNITSNSIVFKESASNFGSIDVPTDNTYLKANMTEGVATYSWVNLDIPTFAFDVNGLIASKNGSMYDINGMSNDGSIYAVQYSDTTSEYSGVSLAQYTTMPYLDTLTTSGFYMIQRDATGGSSGWTLYTAPMDANKTYVYQSTGFVEATPSNLFQLTEAPTSNVMFWYDATGSEYNTVTLPTTSGVDYILTISNNAPVFIENHASFNMTTSLTDAVEITTTAITLLSTTESVVNGHKYNINCKFDIYINDITKLTTTDSTVTGVAFVNSLPELTVVDATTGSTIGTYIIKTNQPLQTVCINKVITATSETAPVINVTVAYKGLPTESPGTGFIQVLASTISGTCSL